MFRDHREEGYGIRQKGGCEIVCCGHTHLELSRPGEVGYFNSGCWTESPSSYLAVDEGRINHHYFEASEKSVEEALSH